ncbi:MAG: symmetrical bis(5'-nucleosyl)-tetraphosphatase [Gammaproteobacteria bacterium]
MSNYVIGDIQGCFDELQTLLRHIDFNKESDRLWITGDLVNRGPQSLEVLRFFKELGGSHKIVLGNHDLHLLAVAFGVAERKVDDTFDAILAAPDREELIDWLRNRALLQYDKELNCIMTHAGIPPVWTLTQTRELALEVEAVLHGATPVFFLKAMYGNQPEQWRDNLMGMERLRCITNYLTRMRFCYADGRLDLSYKGEIAGKPADLYPWFELPNREPIKERILFGHWAALNGKTGLSDVYALDTGCVWGNSLTALRLEDGERFSVSCSR